MTPQTRPAQSRSGFWRARVREMRGDIATAWTHRPVRRGLLGSVLLFLGSLTPAYLPQNSPWWEPMRALGLDNWPARVLGTALVVAASAGVTSSGKGEDEAVSA